MITVEMDMDLRTTTGPAPEEGKIAFSRESGRHYVGQDGAWRQTSMGFTDQMREAMHTGNVAVLATGATKMERILYRVYEEGGDLWDEVDAIIEE